MVLTTSDEQRFGFRHPTQTHEFIRSKTLIYTVTRITVNTSLSTMANNMDRDVTALAEWIGATTGVAFTQPLAEELKVRPRARRTLGTSGGHGPPRHVHASYPCERIRTRAHATGTLHASRARPRAPLTRPRALSPPRFFRTAPSCARW